MILKAPRGFEFTTFTPPLNNVEYLNNVDHIVNDMGRPVDIVALQIYAGAVTTSAAGSGHFFVEVSIGTQDKYDPQTNLFNWIVKGDTGLPSTDVINETIGNFKDTLFTLKPYTSGLSGGMASVGQLFLNVVVTTVVYAVTKQQFLNCYITLYYK